ncbi:DUF4423 domain-containing protein [bacterium]|nr:DUF4423 domain-containing protein [bacterium]
MNLYHSDDYKAVIKYRLLELKSQNPSHNFQSLANQCGVQKTYLSRVLSGGKAELNSDQFFLAIEYLGFAAEEKDYLVLLHEWQRSSLPARRAFLERQLEAVRQQRDRSHHTPAPPLDSGSQLTDYYFNPAAQLVHMFLSIGRYAQDQEQIRKKLGLSRTQFSKVLKVLLQLQIVSLKNGRYSVDKGQMHLPWDSSLIPSYRTLLRLKALDRVSKLERKAYSYSVVFTAAPKDRAAIQKEFVQFLKKFDARVRKAESKEVYQLNFDLFDWSEN